MRPADVLMDIELTSAGITTVACDLLVLTIIPGRVDVSLRALDRAVDGALLAFLSHRSADHADARPALYRPPPGRIEAANVLVIPARQLDRNVWRETVDAALASARQLDARIMGIFLPDDAAVEAAAEGLDLSSYEFQGLRTKPRPRRPAPATTLLLRPPRASTKAALRRGRVCARATCWARDLVNLPASIVTPAYLAHQARLLARHGDLRVRVLEANGLRRAGLQALLAVGRGSAQPPCFIELRYRPPGSRYCVALVGKGITFDSGGLALKPLASMQTQKRDMAGAAVVLAVMSVIRELAPRVEVRGYIPAAENMPGSAAIKPGDVVRTHAGKTVEVLNTDAEGRLALAEGLSVAAGARPDALIDCGTLTAAVRSALGDRYAAIMATDRKLLGDLLAAGAAAGEKFWELPLAPEYRDDLDSEVADLKNTGAGRAVTIVAGLFLREFVGDIPWAHIDFSSTAVTESPFACHPKGASGFGVRTLLRYLASLPVSGKHGQRLAAAPAPPTFRSCAR